MMKVISFAHTLSLSNQPRFKINYLIGAVSHPASKGVAQIHRGGVMLTFKGGSFFVNIK